MQQFCTYGSVRGALGNRRPYRDRSRKIPESQAKPPAPPLGCSNLRSLVGQAFSLPDFRYRLIEHSIG